MPAGPGGLVERPDETIVAHWDDPHTGCNRATANPGRRHDLSADLRGERPRLCCDSGPSIVGQTSLVRAHARRRPEQPHRIDFLVAARVRRHAGEIDPAGGIGREHRTGRPRVVIGSAARVQRDDRLRLEPRNHDGNGFVHQDVVVRQLDDDSGARTAAEQQRL